MPRISSPLCFQGMPSVQPWSWKSAWASAEKGRLRPFGLGWLRIYMHMISVWIACWPILMMMKMMVMMMIAAMNCRCEGVKVWFGEQQGCLGRPWNNDVKFTVQQPWVTTSWLPDAHCLHLSCLRGRRWCLRLITYCHSGIAALNRPFASICRWTHIKPFWRIFTHFSCWTVGKCWACPP